MRRYPHRGWRSSEWESFRKRRTASTALHCRNSAARAGARGGSIDSSRPKDSLQTNSSKTGMGSCRHPYPPDCFERYLDILAKFQIESANPIWEGRETLFSKEAECNAFTLKFDTYPGAYNGCKHFSNAAAPHSLDQITRVCSLAVAPLTATHQSFKNAKMQSVNFCQLQEPRSNPCHRFTRY